MGWIASSYLFARSQTFLATTDTTRNQSNLVLYGEKIFCLQKILWYTVCMKKTEIQNETVSIKEVRLEGEEKGVAAEERTEQRRTSLVRKKSGSCGLRSIAGAFFAFFVFVGVLGVIGFGTVWMLDNEKNIAFNAEKKPSLSEAVKSAEEKVSLDTVSREGKEDSSQEDLGKKESEEKKETSTAISSADAAKAPVLVLNAGGAKGSAGKMADVLKQSGYALAKSGNASVFTYKGVTVFYGDDTLKPVAEAVVAVLKKNSVQALTVRASTADEKKEKIVVMVGE